MTAPECDNQSRYFTSSVPWASLVWLTFQMTAQVYPAIGYAVAPACQSIEKFVAVMSDLAAAAAAMPASEGVSALPALLTIAATPLSRLGLSST